MNRGAGRKGIFHEEEHHLLFLELLDKGSQRFGIEDHAYCLIIGEFTHTYLTFTSIGDPFDSSVGIKEDQENRIETCNCFKNYILQNKCMSLFSLRKYQVKQRPQYFLDINLDFMPDLTYIISECHPKINH